MAEPCGHSSSLVLQLSLKSLTPLAFLLTQPDLGGFLHRSEMLYLPNRNFMKIFERIKPRGSSKYTRISITSPYGQSPAMSLTFKPLWDVTKINISKPKAIWQTKWSRCSWAPSVHLWLWVILEQRTNKCSPCEMCAHRSCYAINCCEYSLSSTTQSDRRTLYHFASLVPAWHLHTPERRGPLQTLFHPGKLKSEK